MLVLFETAAGFALFKILDKGKNSRVEDTRSSLYSGVKRISHILKLEAFSHELKAIVADDELAIPLFGDTYGEEGYKVILVKDDYSITCYHVVSGSTHSSLCCSHAFAEVLLGLSQTSGNVFSLIESFSQLN
ncbi:hypothetical protein RJ639_018648 [Escallonia herrerae]|uniref:Nucleolar protein 58/56 N-terminal domain-containing protein n=1 Tax=Escallonia herrerae TaxID=1293975 RepID=A0AA89AIC4_9ASTE|nr:hypothetical protein RJ639_018648 [Escallonia herrerae]